MDLITQLLDLFLNLDEMLHDVILQYGAWTYGLLFLVIFMETGFVVTPFLPGDSLIFAAATFAAKGSLNPWLLFLLLAIAAIAGDTANYWIGHAVGARAYTGEVKWIKKDYIDRTHAFFEKHGGKTIVLARFVPIIRTFAPLRGRRQPHVIRLLQHLQGRRMHSLGSHLHYRRLLLRQHPFRAEEF